jgi:hypothetical protein
MTTGWVDVKESTTLVLKPFVSASGNEPGRDNTTQHRRVAQRALAARSVARTLMVVGKRWFNNGREKGAIVDRFHSRSWSNGRSRGVVASIRCCAASTTPMPPTTYVISTIMLLAARRRIETTTVFKNVDRRGRNGPLASPEQQPCSNRYNRIAGRQYAKRTQDLMRVSNPTCLPAVETYALDRLELRQWRVV